ncbi:glutamate--cysteine ligase [Limosilactobacillus fermentum]|uniref:Glutamate--cysteine ligase n=1 Tax=Limosilactobacillus fermentum TaxID=1613 RepID=A0AAJ6CZJ3_LIMFE|nr:glutamate--cysteine ligase [Limosilactobacillus fermentum]WFR88386.1 glutamate--cysteine ligase [Limosilactobacillus fermentum]SNX31665.1 putative glutamate--cysteine ligase [Limosilactobacillus fermentum]
MESIEAIIQQQQLAGKLFDGFFGLEVEQHRVLTNGKLSRHPYPAAFSSRRHNPYLKTDFCDNMFELAAPPVQGATAAVQNLKYLQQIVNDHLAADERIWPLSIMAPLSADDLAFATTFNTRQWMADYHDYLGAKYGIARELMAGVHVNFSLHRDLIAALFAASGQSDLAAFKNHLYFRLAQGFVAHRWLFTYLFGASPVLANPLKGMPDNLAFPVRSLRSSDFGYTNFPSETITYSSLGAQLDQLKRFVAEGKFYSLHEFYGPVRLKSRGANLDDLIAHGTERLEFRAFDLDPLSRAGISNDTLNFLEVFLAYWLVADQEADLTEADEKNQAVALQHPHQEFDWTKERGLALLDDLDAFVAKYGAPKEYQAALLFARRRLEDPRLTIGGQLIDKADPDGGLLSYGLKIANSHHDWYKSMAYPLQPTIATYPAPAQELIKAAIELGIKAKVTQNSFALILGDHQEQYAANQAFDLTNGAKQAVLVAFPEQVNYTDQVDQVQV